MGILKRAHEASLIVAIALASSTAWSATPPLLTGVDGTLNGLVGGGAIYGAGSTLQFIFGSEMDPDNRSGEFHAGYTSQVSPLDPSNLASPSKHSDNWAGGLSVNTWKNGTLGVDLDSIVDSSELVNIDGVRFTLGQDPIKFSYRYARNVINGDFIAGLAPHKFTASGAFIYQQTFELTGDIELNEADTLTPEISYSLFNPDAPEFANLFNQANLASIASFQDTLQSFEQWSIGLSWKRNDLRKKWDTTIEARLAHVIISARPTIETTISLGYKFSDRIQARLGWNYMDEPTVLVQNLALFELHFVWDRRSNGTRE